VVDENLARPILIGRPAVIDMRIEKLGLNLKSGRDFDVVNIESDSRYRELWQEYYRLMGRDGVTPDSAREALRADSTLIGCMLLRRGDADALICGTTGSYDQHFRHVENLIGQKRGASLFASMNILLLPKRVLAIADTYVNEMPNAEETAEIALMAADEMRRFGIEPKVALLSHSNFGSARSLVPEDARGPRHPAPQGPRPAVRRRDAR
jgi:malate dehydrogenase (oxaloacetate-decarboxylating)(NADP+)